MKNEMIKPIAKLFTFIYNDYEKFIENPDMRAKFATELDYKEGRKYIKVLNGRGVWGFIVNTDNDPKFQYGDILKAAGYNAPARNQARGNVFQPETFENGVRWTGPAYLY